MTAAIFWDIDGTLLTTARAGVFALEAAARELGAASADLRELHTSGLTDWQVALLALEHCGLDRDADSTTQFLRVYERHLPASLPLAQGAVLPGVAEILDDLHGRPDVQLFLLTGNTPAGAEAKLMHYGLAGYFDGRGAFSTDARDRGGIARQAAVLADGAASLFVVGDTPHDIKAAREIGARAIAVATGVYGGPELARHEPWALLERLPNPERFRRLLAIE